MNTLNPAATVIVFDLDDTLYAEYDYKISGIRSVIQTVCTLYPQYSEARLAAAVDADSAGWLDDLCAFCGFNEAEKHTLLWQYRLHRPSVRPFCDIEWLRDLIRPFAAAALISDGRSLTQRLKLDALGLLPLFDDVLISEAYRSEKPCDKRFVALQNRYGRDSHDFIYIGDNIKKDFVAPNRLGWLTIGLEASPRNIHIHKKADFDAAHQPHYWINALGELNQLFAELTDQPNRGNFHD